MRRLLRGFLLSAFLLAPRAAASQVGYWGDYRLFGEYATFDHEDSWYGEQEINARLRFPVLDWRLGSLELGTGLYWDTFRGPGEKSSTGGLGSYHAELSLFPYRSFPVTVYLQRFRRDRLGGLPGWSTTSAGIRWSLRTRSAGQWLFNAEEDRFERGEDSSTRRLFRIDQNRTAGSTTAVLHAELQEIRPSGGAVPLAFGWANYSTLSRLGEGATFTTTTYLHRTRSRGYGWTGITTSGILNKPLAKGFSWTLSGQGGAGWGASSTAGALGAATWLERVEGGKRFFAGGNLEATRWTGGGAAGRTARAGVFGGMTRSLGAGWQVTGDAALRNLSGDVPRAGAGTESVFHLGVSRGSSLPSWVSNLAFAFKDISFERRLYEVFPPGYRSPEVEALRRAYYEQARGGRQSFGLDATHLSAKNRIADALWLRGGLQFNHTLGIQVFGEWFREAGSSKWRGSENRDLTLQMTWAGRSGCSLSAFATTGYTKQAPLASEARAWFRQGTFHTEGLSFTAGLLRGGTFRISAQKYTSELGGSYNQVWAQWDWGLRDLHVQVVGSYARVIAPGAFALLPARAERRRVQINLVRTFRGNAY